VSGAALLSLAARTLLKRLDTTVHAASLVGNLYGYVDGFAGSIDDATYDDLTGTSRTISVIYGDGGFDTTTVLTISGGAPDADATFEYIQSAGVKFYRRDAVYSGGDTWTWGNGIFVGGAADHDLEVWA
jgi:hypothetical protein